MTKSRAFKQKQTASNQMHTNQTSDILIGFRFHMTSRFLVGNTKSSFKAWNRLNNEPNSNSKSSFKPSVTKMSESDRCLPNGGLSKTILLHKTAVEYQQHRVDNQQGAQPRSVQRKKLGLSGKILMHLKKFLSSIRPKSPSISFRLTSLMSKVSPR